MSYNNFYKLKEKEKLEVLTAIGEKIGVPAFAVEKDWWVVRTLELIFNLEISNHLVFKGGTSLSKAWNLIDRFSEDIDLALDKRFLGFERDDLSRSQVGKLRKTSLIYIFDKLFPEIKTKIQEAGMEDVTVNIEEAKSSDQDPLIIEIYYPSVTEQSDYVQPRVLIEIGSRSQREPFTNRNIQSFIGEHLPKGEFSDDPIVIPAVNPERTYLEKLFLLHEEFQRPKEKIRVNRLSRHLYDIYKISSTDYAANAIGDKELYKSIVEHRSRFAKLDGVDYTTHFPPNLSSVPPDKYLPAWEKDYKIMQDQMIYGESISFEKIIDNLNKTMANINLLNLS